MIRLELNDMEQETLRQALAKRLSSLVDEIAHTDTRDYRDFLKERKEILTGIHDRLH
ncbi:hypothetical protein [Geothermobacter hydrogeniphilus]|uniref:hypothetical protein n=1 Tax=Geothermobacter hydrogeniphilus TaxID=1969733 RepID=UPI0015569D38|nr:hypothetical protein [Geothermobacter hydrogeniphilus]